MNHSPRRPLHHHALAILSPLAAHWHHGRYHGKHHHLVIDSGLNLLMLGVALWLGIGLWFIRPATDITISATTTTAYMNETMNLQVVIHNTASKSLDATNVATRVPKDWKNVTPSAEMMLGQILPDQSASTTLKIATIGRSGRTYPLNIIVRGERAGQPTMQWIRLRIRPQAMRVTFPATSYTATIGRPRTIQVKFTSTAAEVLPTVAIRLKATNDIAVAPPREFLQSEIAPTGTGAFTVTITPKRTGSLRLPIELGSITERGFILERIVQLTIKSASSTTPEDIIHSAPQLGANMSAEAVYYSAVGFQFGYGQFPPRVNKETAFRIFWHIRPSTTPATNAVVSARLPAGVQWAGNVSVTAGSAITVSGNTIRWALGNWNGGQEVITGSFDVRLTPTSAMRGQYPVLVHAATLTYQDATGRVQTVQSSSATTRTADPNKLTAGRVTP